MSGQRPGQCGGTGAPLARPFRIVFSGIRPGEKLQEGLVGLGDVSEASAVEGIVQVQSAPLSEPLALRRRSSLSSVSRTATIHPRYYSSWA